MSPTAPCRPLPPDDALRASLHDEVHARPPARIRLPARVVYVAVIHDGVSRADECEHLRRLPGQQSLQPEDLQRNFLQLHLPGRSLKWERHAEFTRYTLIGPQPAGWRDGADDGLGAAERSWLAAIPGRTIVAVDLAMVHGAIADRSAALAHARRWFGDGEVVASVMGSSPGSAKPGDAALGHPDGHSIAVTDFRLRTDGFERVAVIAPEGTSATRCGRVAQRLLEIETYRLMALRGLPAARELAPTLVACEAALADLTARLEDASATDQALLDALIGLAAGVERATAQHMVRFSATQAYDRLVSQRIAELRERAIPGTQTIGEFMQRRLAPAIATVASTAQRLAALSQRIERTGALLRTRVDIATEAQNQQLLARLTRGQALQLQLQRTVEGLSIAAISYYVVSLVLYGGKAAKSAGLPLEPELLAGVSIPLVLWAVWRATRAIHDRLQRGD